MTTIYRVEHVSTRLGPYRGARSCGHALAAKHDGSLSHPTWPSDGMYFDFEPGSFLDRSNFISGFDSLEKLFTWFAGFMDMLVANGFWIRVYYVDPSLIVHGRSRKQLAFIAPQE